MTIEGRVVLGQLLVGEVGLVSKRNDPYREIQTLLVEQAEFVDPSGYSTLNMLKQGAEELVASINNYDDAMALMASPSPCASRHYSNRN